MRTTTRRIAAVLAVVLALGAPAADAGAAPSQAATNYVALGDSYTSGGGIPNQLTNPLGCWRSDKNWPHLIAGSTGTAELRDMTCSGADTGDMTNPQNTDSGTNPAQLSAIDANTRVVTLQIGGNDIGFGGIVEDCALAPVPWGSPCKDDYTDGGVDELSVKIAEAAPKVGAVLDGIAARAPTARVIVVGYPSLVPDSGRGCWPKLAVAWGDVPYLRAKTHELNGMLAAQAAAHGAGFVDLYTPSIGKDACASSSVRWVEPLIPANWGAPFHPNDRGHRGMATVVRAAL